MEPYRIFISSIMNRATEDLIAERNSARAVVEEFTPVTTPWAFEVEPASVKPLLDFYLDGVKSSDLFVLLLGSHITPPVKSEFDVARDHGKPILVFAKEVPERSPEANQILNLANVKYDMFTDATDLREKLRRSLGTHLLTLIRGDSERSFNVGNRGVQLRAFAQNRTAVQVSPLLPDCQFNRFSVRSVEAGVVTLEKESNRQSLTVPLHRVEDILPGSRDERATLLLNGRLQWITVPQVWRFFPEKPLPGDPIGLGFAKERARENPGVPTTIAPFVGWSLPQNVPARRAAGCEVFYDEDGKYLTSAGQILLVRMGG